MTGNHPCRQAMSRDEAIDELRRFSGMQFAPGSVERFIGIVEDESGIGEAEAAQG